MSHVRLSSTNTFITNSVTAVVANLVVITVRKATLITSTLSLVTNTFDFNQIELSLKPYAVKLRFHFLHVVSEFSLVYLALQSLKVLEVAMF